MKKISLITMGNKKEDALKTLRKLGIVQIEISEGTGEKLGQYKEQITLLERAIYSVGKPKKVKQESVDTKRALEIAFEIDNLSEIIKSCISEKSSLNIELDRLKGWGDIDPKSIEELAEKGIEVAFYEMPTSEYKNLPDEVKAVKLFANKSSVKLLIRKNAQLDEELDQYKLVLPNLSTSEMRSQIDKLNSKIAELENKIASYVCYVESFKQAIKALEKDVEFETYATGMNTENLSTNEADSVTIAYFKGFIEAEKIDKLKKTAKENCWGLSIEEPTEEDNVPTKLKNNKFVSLIYPLTDFLGTVPGYFEYDISGWFLGFILIFFGIIFGDGGYGLIIFSIATVPILKSLFSKKDISPAFLLMGLFGLSTILWGTLTSCRMER
ncbi:MAG: hypothetical protein IJD86_08975 [Clostridia bacterium]|nr:hypothetical protein [Clostridia bacterium]